MNKSVPKTKLRSMNSILLDMETLLEELTDEDKHSLQYGEILYLIYSWLEIHAPHAKEIYLDKSSPILYYGPKK